MAKNVKLLISSVAVAGEQLLA